MSLSIPERISLGTKEKRIRYATILLLDVFFFCLFFSNCKPSQNDQTPIQKFDNYQSIIDSIYNAHPASTGIMVHIESLSNDVSWSGCAGYSNARNKTKLKADQPALIASSIKTYISATILRLQEQGKLKIEDKISSHLTRKTIELFEADGYDFDQIKVKHLLSHTSGIEDYFNDDYFDLIDQDLKHRWTRDEQLALATKVGSPLGDAGNVFRYADANFLLLTEIIEGATDKAFYESIREQLRYKELGISNTWFPTLESKNPETDSLVHQYWGKRNWDSYDHDISWDLYGGGGIATTPKELAQFSYQLFNGGVIKDSSILNLIFTEIKTKDQIDNRYHLGLSRGGASGFTGYGHGGFWGTVVMYFPKLDASISVFVLERNENKLRKNILNAMVNELANEVYQDHESTTTDDYILQRSTGSKETLILFPGGGSTSKQTKEEFNVLSYAAANDVSVLMMNFNRHIWIDEKQTETLAGDLEEILKEHQLSNNRIYIGGMSIGGNVALTLSDLLHKNKSEIAPEGVFIIDSPIDLYELYKNAEKDLSNPDFDEKRLAEPNWIVNYFKAKFGTESMLSNIEEVSPFTFKTKKINIPNLKQSKIRFYTEPDAEWWMENRGTEFENTNAFAIQNIAKQLDENNWSGFELIETKNKGYRANGNRHPHSWSIADVKELITWIKNK